jgi:lactoylglutathione lyase
MSETRLNLLVLKTQQPDRLKDFYSVLGLSFAEERHGDGPLHFAARIGEVVLELYPLPADACPADDSTRLGFAVPNLDAALQSLDAVGAVLVSQPKTTPWGRRAVVRDPDGRAVEVVDG